MNKSEYVRTRSWFKTEHEDSLKIKLQTAISYDSSTSLLIFLTVEQVLQDVFLFKSS